MMSTRSTEILKKEHRIRKPELGRRERAQRLGAMEQEQRSQAAVAAEALLRFVTIAKVNFPVVAVAVPGH